MIKTLSVFDIVTDATNLRSETDFTEDDAVLEQRALTDNLKELPLQNLPSVNLIDGTYRCIQGHRRLYALRELAKENRDKYSAVDCLVFEGLTDAEVAKLQLSTNILQRGLSAVEIGRTLLILKDELEQHMKKGEVAAFAGLSRSDYSQYLKAMRLPSWTRNEIERRSVSTGHAMALIRLLPKQKKNEEIELTKELAEQIDALTHQIIEEKLNVDATRDLVDAILEGKPEKEKKSSELVGAYLTAQKDLAHLYGGRATVHGKDGKGYIKVSFADEVELNNIKYKMTFIDSLKRDYPDISKEIGSRIDAARRKDVVAVVENPAYADYIYILDASCDNVEMSSEEIDTFIPAIENKDAILCNETPTGDNLLRTYTYIGCVYVVKYADENPDGDDYVTEDIEDREDVEETKECAVDYRTGLPITVVFSTDFPELDFDVVDSFETVDEDGKRIAPATKTAQDAEFNTQTLCTLSTCPVSNYNYPSALLHATDAEINKAVDMMRGKVGNKSRIEACEKELRKRGKKTA